VTNKLPKLLINIVIFYYCV